MGIIHFFIVACFIGLIVYLIQTYAPIPAPFKTVILWAGVIVIVLILLQALGIFPGWDYPIPRLR
jgi:hypothetical protein